MSANLYKTKNEGEFFHIHGSLEASTTLNMIGLDGHRPDLTDYEEIIQVIESHVQKYSAAELEAMNAERKQAGVTALKHEDFIKTPHVRLPSFSFETELGRKWFVLIQSTSGTSQCTRASVESNSPQWRFASDAFPQLQRRQEDP